MSDWAPEDSKAYKAAYLAVTEGNTSKLEAAITPEININALYGDGLQEGLALLHVAVSGGDVNIMSYLLAHGAHVDIRACDKNPESNDQETPLFYAARNGHPGAVRLLLDAGADITIQGSSQQTALNLVLIWATYARPGGRTVKIDERHIKTINILLDHGLDINNTPDMYFSGTLVGSSGRADMLST